MKRLAVSFALLSLLIGPTVFAWSTDNHTGSYLYAMGGFSTVTHDTNARTNLKFGGAIIPSFGLTYGYNITDWIAPEIQFSYATGTGNTPSGRSREHVLNVRINAKYSFLTNQAMNQSGNWRYYPYVKAGGVVHGLFVNAQNDNDKIGAYGGGVGLGGGLEINYKALYLGLDISNDLLFLQGQTKTIGGVQTTILDGGFAYMFTFAGAIGVHF